MKRLLLALAVVVVSSFFLDLTISSGSEIVASQGTGGAEQDKQKEIDDLQSKVNDLQKKAATLSDQIFYYDSQIKLATLKIDQTETLIATLSSKINTLEERLQKRAKVLERQIVQTYKQGKADSLSLYFSSDNFSQIISQYKYLQIIQVQNRKFLHDTQVVQTSYATQKTLMQESKKKLEAQKISLAQFKSDRENILTQTKNDEAVYQKQLEQSRQELLAIQRALAAAVSEGPVKKGDPIALMGNSGYPSCSTGQHLHFEVRVNDQWVNAETYLKNATDKWGLNIGSGNWDWPLQGDVEVTQRYGKTPYSYRYLYSGGIHTGVDIVSGNPVIHAVADGTLYSYVGKCGTSDLKMKYIDHGNGLKTLYLHVQ